MSTTTKRWEIYYLSHQSQTQISLTNFSRSRLMSPSIARWRSIRLLSPSIAIWRSIRLLSPSLARWRKRRATTTHTGSGRTSVRRCWRRSIGCDVRRHVTSPRRDLRRPPSTSPCLQSQTVAASVASWLRDILQIKHFRHVTIQQRFQIRLEVDKLDVLESTAAKKLPIEYFERLTVSSSRPFIY